MGLRGSTKEDGHVAITSVGLDLAKNVFQVHEFGQAVLRKKVRRDQVLAFFDQMPRCVVAMETCGGAHYCGRWSTRG
ncbi:hypothetical protein GCM10011341_37520 [Frigidibacter albus]|nr:hypothetical protein GCM10011341_37520 [Frigidibacter albus]